MKIFALSVMLLVASIGMWVTTRGEMKQVERERSIPPPSCKNVGEKCVRWHNAVVLWQWNGEGVVDQWPTVVCDKWDSK